MEVRVLATALSLLFLLSLLAGSSAHECGWQAEDALCPGGRCCSKWGWCGDTEQYCGTGCQSQCNGDDDDEEEGIAEIFSEEDFEEMLGERNDFRCTAREFYWYDDFIKAAKSFPEFGTTGDNETRKREIAAFFAQTSHATNGEDFFPDDEYEWGYCFKDEGTFPWPENHKTYCKPSLYYRCAPGMSYHGRGPFQL